MEFQIEDIFRLDAEDTKAKISTCYYHEGSRSIADLCLLANGWMLITRINVPRKSRGARLGSRILNEILRDADRFGVTLVLEPVPSDGLKIKALSDWYERNGFTWINKGMMLRTPRTDRTLGELSNVDAEIKRTRNDV
jgi:GNAT superfamily N-acetyltransferase